MLATILTLHTLASKVAEAPLPTEELPKELPTEQPKVVPKPWEPATSLPGAITLSNSHYMSSTPYHDRYGYGEMSSIWGLNVVEGFTGGISLMSSHYVIFMENTE